MTPDPSLTQALDTLRRRRTALDDAIHAIERVIADEYPTSTPAEAPAKSTPKAIEWKPVRQPRRGARTDTAEAIIKDRGAFGVSPQELADAMAERGVPIRSENPARAARAVADRVRERNPDVKLVEGRFVHRPESTNGTEPAASETPDVEQQEEPWA
jgi:ribosome-binding protein aMBF1 (putative translation factor)